MSIQFQAVLGRWNVESGTHLRTGTPYSSSTGGQPILSDDLETDHGGFKILEEPPYSAECWAEYACQYPTAEVYIVVRTELLQTAPDAVEFLRKWDFHAGIQIPAERFLEETGADDPEVAIWVLQNTTDWYDWVTLEARDKVLAALAG